jgi:hypothetical protein
MRRRLGRRPSAPREDGGERNGEDRRQQGEDYEVSVHLLGIGALMAFEKVIGGRPS